MEDPASLTPFAPSRNGHHGGAMTSFRLASEYDPTIDERAT